MAVTRQQLEQQLVAAHRTKNVQAAQQAAYAIRAYDQNVLSAQVPSINAPPPIDRVPKPTFGSWLGNVTAGIGEGLGEQVQGLGGMIQRGVTAFAQDPLKASAAAFMTALEPARQGFTQPVQAAKDVGTGIVETGKQMYQQATSGPIGLGQTMGQMIDLPGPSLPGGKRRPTMAELNVYHGTPHTFDPEEGASLGRFRSKKIGTGEGAQAYGYGLYLAENKKIGIHYKETLSKKKQTSYTYNGIDSKKLPTPYTSPEASYSEQYIREVNDGKNPEQVIAEMKNRAKDWLSREKRELKRYEDRIGKTVDIHGGKNDYPEYYTYTKNDMYVHEEGVKVAQRYFDVIDKFTPETVKFVKPTEASLYKVDLPDAKIEQMLDWDKPFSQQSDHVKQVLKDSGIYQEYRANLSDFSSPMGTRNRKMRGENFLAFVENKFQSEAREKVRNGELIEDTSSYGAKKAAEYLQSLGIPGIKYLDASSRSGTKNTRNFVVFPGEEQSLNILERN